MQRQPVQSSNIVSVGFDDATKTLEVEFRGGGVYSYTGPTAEQHYKAMMAAQSKGEYLHKSIRTDKTLTVRRVS